MIKADIIKNLKDNNLISVNNGVYALPADSQNDHHASQILQVKMYSDQSNSQYMGDKNL